MAYSRQLRLTSNPEFYFANYFVGFVVLPSAISQALDRYDTNWLEAPDAENLNYFSSVGCRCFASNVELPPFFDDALGRFQTRQLILKTFKKVQDIFTYARKTPPILRPSKGTCRESYRFRYLLEISKQLESIHFSAANFIRTCSTNLARQFVFFVLHNQ